MDAVSKHYPREAREKNFGDHFLLDCKLVEIKPAVVIACKFDNFTALSSQDQDFSRPCCLNPSPMLRFDLKLIVRRWVLVHFNIVQLNGAMHWKCNAYPTLGWWGDASSPLDPPLLITSTLNSKHW
jgi:hypothetical protein